MKKVLFILTLAVVVLSSAVVNAQDKIGYISSSEVIGLFPEAETIMKEVDQIGAVKQGQMTELQNELQSKYEKYQAEEALMTDIIKESKAEEIRNMEAKIQEFYKQSQDELVQIRNEKMKPLLDRASTAISDVAKENGYTYIVDTDAGAALFLYADESRNVIDLVKAKLGL